MPHAPVLWLKSYFVISFGIYVLIVCRSIVCVRLVWIAFGTAWVCTHHTIHTHREKKRAIGIEREERRGRRRERASENICEWYSLESLEARINILIYEIWSNVNVCVCPRRQHTSLCMAKKHRMHAYKQRLLMVPTLNNMRTMGTVYVAANVHDYTTCTCT